MGGEEEGWAEGGKGLVQAVMEHGALSHSLSLFPGKKAKLADKVNESNFTISTTTSIFTVIQMTELFDVPDASLSKE